MASKAYVVAMTVSELKEELKQRGLSTKGSKKDLRDRLEQVRYLKIRLSHYTTKIRIEFTTRGVICVNRSLSLRTNVFRLSMMKS